MDKHKKKGGEGEKAIIRVQENEKGLAEREPRKGATTNRLLPERQGAAEWRPTKERTRKGNRRDVTVTVTVTVGPPITDTDPTPHTPYTRCCSPNRR